MWYFYVGVVFAILVFVYESLLTEDDFWKSFVVSIVAGIIWPAIILNMFQLMLRGKLFRGKL